MKMMKIALMLGLFLMAGMTTAQAQKNCNPAECVKKCATKTAKTTANKAQKSVVGWSFQTANIFPDCDPANCPPKCCKKGATAKATKTALKTKAVKTAQKTTKTPCCKKATTCKKGTSKVALVSK